MVVVYGKKVITTFSSGGCFHCFTCKREMSFQKRSSRVWYHIFFIPFVPAESLGEWIVCSGCNQEFTPDALKGLVYDQIAIRVLEAKIQLRTGCSHWSIAEVLKAEKVPNEQIDEIVRQAFGGSVRTCQKCGGMYLPTMSHCFTCNIDLGPAIEFATRDFSDIVKLKQPIKGSHTNA